MADYRGHMHALQYGFAGPEQPTFPLLFEGRDAPRDVYSADQVFRKVTLYFATDILKQGLCILPRKRLVGERKF